MPSDNELSKEATLNWQEQKFHQQAHGGAHWWIFSWDDCDVRNALRVTWCAMCVSVKNKNLETRDKITVQNKTWHRQWHTHPFKNESSTTHVPGMVCFGAKWECQECQWKESACGTECSFLCQCGWVCKMGVDLFWAGMHRSKSKILRLRWEGENNGLRSDKTQKVKKIRRKKWRKRGRIFFYGKSSDDWTKMRVELGKKEKVGKSSDIERISMRIEAVDTKNGSSTK